MIHIRLTMANAVFICIRSLSVFSVNALCILPACNGEKKKRKKNLNERHGATQRYRSNAIDKHLFIHTPLEYSSVCFVAFFSAKVNVFFFVTWTSSQAQVRHKCYPFHWSHLNDKTAFFIIIESIYTQIKRDGDKWSSRVEQWKEIRCATEFLFWFIIGRYPH